MHNPVPGGKQWWRARVGAARKGMDLEDRARARARNRDHVAGELSDGTVCAFHPLPSEPLDAGVLDDLHGASTTVLVPVTGKDAPLDWVRYPVPTVPGSFGIEHPQGSLLGPAAIAGADVVLVPAFAIDHSGRRLGRGGGHYDRSLALLEAATRIVAVLYDDEFVDRLPDEPHDIRVHGIVRPSTGLTWL
ncbi:5-formyltetrahydrofolate cyclo-ligase [Nakamurella sp. YIM 132087]|uniref:5-formyltetrahydrofolate cyclo-ligase n=1 Tax=Nakamurella alba TaxID=2665158 RepID=A0A7K1FEQ3_9ACTN|nr:5-formyltetrahydrofolate cyclo-ligase [Nakamurella alba]MTD12587.1 5-formyltetrahydrofolate cyclo-ligase [Nakamurella alba]